MYTLDEMCCLCNKKESLLISTQETDNDVKKYIDKLKYVFPDLMLMTKMDEYLKLICLTCKDALKQVYKFKEQCKTAFSIRKAYYFSDDETNDTNNELTHSFNDDNKIIDKKTSFKDENDSDFEEHLYIEPEEDLEDEQSQKIEMVNIKSSEEPVISSPSSSSPPITTNNEVEEEEENEINIPVRPYKTRTATKSRKNKEALKKNVVETLTYLADHNENFFLCKRCNKQFANPRTLQAHMLRHTGLKKYVCNFCGKQNYTLSEHQSHMVLHRPDQPFSCTVCTKSFKEKARLATHMRSHTKDRKYMCDLCGKKFIYLSNLNCHKLMHSDERTYECKICKKAFKMHSTLKVHMDMHKNRTFQCEVCKKLFQTYAGYYRHKIKHNVEPRFKCDVCDKSYYFKSVLSEHMRTHTQEKPFSCTLCKKEFGSKYVLKIHNLTHTGERPYRCTVCEKTFAQSGTLSVHMRLHTGVRPYKCKLCDKAFIKSHHYDNHMKKQHSAEYNVNVAGPEADPLKTTVPLVIHESKYTPTVATTPTTDPPKCNIVSIPVVNHMLC